MRIAKGNLLFPCFRSRISWHASVSYDPLTLEMNVIDPKPSVSVVIPTLNAGRWLPDLLDALAVQEPQPPTEIVLVDSGSTDDTANIAATADRVQWLPIDRFTHGGARNTGIRAAGGDIVVLMTQDAIPANPKWLQALLAPLDDAEVGAVYSRQVPRSHVSAVEEAFLFDRFPDGDRIVRRHDGEGIPVYPLTFFSNVSAAARRSTWLEFPFDETLIMSEDQQFARDILLAGLAIVYEPASIVLHSHEYGLIDTFKRYFDSVVAFRQLSRRHKAAASAQLGHSTVGREMAYVARNRPLSLPHYLMHTMAKAMGVAAAHAADRMPPSWCARCSMQPTWWQRPQSTKNEE